MKGKDIYLVIIGLVTVICVIIGSFLNIVMPAAGLIPKLFSDKDGNSYFFGKNAGFTIEEDTIFSDAYSDLSIEASALSVKIVTGKDYSFSFRGPEKYAPKIDVHNGTARVIQNGIGTVKNIPEEILLTITIKEDDPMLSSLDIDLDFGEVEVSGASADSLNIQADFGSIKVNDGEYSNTKVEADFGEVSFKNTKFMNSLEIQADCGSIEITNPGDWTDADIEAETEVGSVDFDIEGHKYTGREYDRDGAGVEVRLYADLGSIEVR